MIVLVSVSAICFCSYNICCHFFLIVIMFFYGLFVAVPDLLKGDPYVPSDPNRQIKVWIQDHSPVGSNLSIHTWYSL